MTFINYASREIKDAQLQHAEFQQFHLKNPLRIYRHSQVPTRSSHRSIPEFFLYRRDAQRREHNRRRRALAWATTLST